MAGTILIVDDLATNRIVLKSRLAAACYGTLQASDGASAQKLARQTRPDLILLDMALPDMPGIDLCRSFKADPSTRDIPVIMLTAEGNPVLRVAMLHAGADDYLAKPVDETMLLARIRSLLRARETEEELRLRDLTAREGGFAEAPEGFDGFYAAESAPGTYALIASKRQTALAWRRALAPFIEGRVIVLPREAALSDSDVIPDVYMIAADLDGRNDGMRLMSELRSRTGTRQSAICIVLPPEAGEAGPMALDLGANELLPADFDPEETALRLRAQLRRKRQADRLRASVRIGLRLAVTDPLTGLYNRRYAMPHLARIAEKARQTGRRYAIMVLDLDHFKDINDTWGHAAGDAVLVEVARRLRENLRPVDLLARIGGEEFLVAMPDARLGTARMAAERLCRVVEQTPVTLPGDAGRVTVTLSIGLALGESGPECGGAGAQVMDRADRALRAAKTEGRNKVSIGRQAA